MILRALAALPRPRLSWHPSCMTCKSKMSGSSKQISPKFISLEDGEDIKCFKFRLVSYNILAQELDEYDSFYKSNLENSGYSSIYIQRNGQKRDGCGIFYKLNCAELVLMEEIYYNDLANSLNLESRETSGRDFSDKDNHNDHGDPNNPRVRLTRDCVGLLAAFKLNDPSHHMVIVANTHIYWYKTVQAMLLKFELRDPEWVDVKLAQVKYLLLRLAQFKKTVSDKYSCFPSVIIAGDFNSTPGDEVYEYLLSAPPIQLYSLYGRNGGEPPFTNCTPGFTGTLDYIFLLNTSSLKPVGLLQVPGPESPDVINGLPNHHHPSDHLPIGGDFEVLSNSNSASTSSRPGANPICSPEEERQSHGRRERVLIVLPCWFQ